MRWTRRPLFPSRWVLGLLFALVFGKPLPAPVNAIGGQGWARSSVGRASDF